jgi:hypothetical protein
VDPLVSDYGPSEVAALYREERDLALAECKRLRDVLRVALTEALGASHLVVDDLPTELAERDDDE